ncbi:amidase [Halomarina litorea]|uniref:amidase n=1 Tax=Halomarina litorea TaxID=2961595 RepID=UPI0020C49B1F|nr:amidase [Halomarina sp. BCD28]
MSTDPFRSASDLAAAVRSGDVSPVDLVDSYLDRIESRGDHTTAFVTVVEESARERAREAERAVEAGEYLGPLHGVPVAIKDLADAKAGVRHTFGMKPLADNVADRTTVGVERLEAAGAIVVGTTNTPELGHTVRTLNELVGPTATPFDADYNAGGSSGGSAAALADGLCALATGSDVGGSLRTPAACCNVASVKPTFGLVPRDARPDAFRGHTPFGVLGPMARTVDDLALALDVLAGQDDRDPYSVPKPDEYADATDASADEFTVGYSPDLDRFPVEPAVRETVGDALDALSSAGATVEEVSVGGPERGDLVYAYGVTATTLFATVVREMNEARGMDLLADHAEDLSPTFEQTVRMGQGGDAVEYTTRDVTRTAWYDAVEDALEGNDALVCPALATPPLTHDEPLPTEIDGQSVGGLPMDWALSWPFNLTGHPVVTVPAGLVDGLPVGLQIVTRRFDERTGLGIAAAFEDANPWADRYPDA